MHTIINTGSVIEHGANIGIVHIAPNATVLGDVKIGPNLVGSSTVIQQGVRIGKIVS